jgi:hypothetical protein
VACGHIWFAPDVSDDDPFDTHRVDRTFDEPARERRTVAHVYGGWQSDVTKFVMEEEDGGDGVDEDVGDDANRGSVNDEDNNEDEDVASDEDNDEDDDDDGNDSVTESEESGGGESLQSFTEEHEEVGELEADDEIGDDVGDNEKLGSLENDKEIGEQGDDELDEDDNDDEETEEGGRNRNVHIDALQPITFKECCIPASLKRSKNPSDVNCFGTCFTERACDDMVYPFNSAEEKEQFPSKNMTLKDRLIRRLECMSPDTLTPPSEWCQKPHMDTKRGSSAHLVNGIPPAGCSIASNSGGSGPFQHVILFPSAKLAFCGIPKVGITMWEQFLRFYIGAKDYPSLPHYKLDRTPLQFDQLDPDAQRRIWDDEEWTWAAFIRNPAERLLSGYLDKVKSNEDKLRWIDGSLTFEAFIDALSKPSNLTQVFDDAGQVISQKCTSGNSSLFGLTWCSDPRKYTIL